MPTDELPLRPSGRFEREAAVAVFPRFQAEAEAALASAGALALATAHRLPDAPPAGTRLPILTPLLAYDETRIRRELEAFACA